MDSYFAFRSPTLTLHRASVRALAAQLLDVLPHPLYTLLAALERVAPAGSTPEVVSVLATPIELHVLLRQADCHRSIVDQLARAPSGILAHDYRLWGRRYGRLRAGNGDRRRQ